MYPISPVFEELLRKPDREFKVKALINGEEYGNNEIVDFTIDNSITSMNGFEVGTAIPSVLTISIRSTKEVSPNSKVVPYVALSTANLSWEETNIPWNQLDIPWDGSGTSWLPLGEFYIDKREKINSVWTYTCLDKLVFADVAYISSLTYPATMKAVWDEIMVRLGWTYDSSVVINPSYMIQVGPAGYTMRQVLGYIAGANSASVTIGKDGKVRFRRFSASDQPVFEMTPSDYVRAKQLNPIKTYSRVVVTYNTEDDLSYEAGTGSEDNTLTFENPFMTQTMVNNLLSNLNGFAYLPVSVDARGFPQLEVGDLLGFEQDESSAWMDTDIAWQDLHIPWNGMVKYRTVILKQVYGFKGGLKMTIESPSISAQQSEFVVEGSLTQQVNKLDKNAIKEGKKYYGATITRTEGLIIEREDHLSKAVFNSDELSFYANGERALWFDLPSREFIFGGNLQAAGGTFSGDLSAVGGTFTGTLVGVDGTFSGTVSAGRVESSDIVGAYIQGSTITGTTMIGNTIMTATNGERIVLDPYGFEFFDYNNTRRVSLGTNQVAGISGHTYFNAWGQSLGLIYAITDELHVMGNENLRLGTNQGGITYGQGTWKFIGVLDLTEATVIGI